MLRLFPRLPFSRSARPARRKARSRATAAGQVDWLESRTMLSAVPGVSLPAPAQSEAMPDLGFEVNTDLQHESRLLVQFRPDAVHGQSGPLRLPAGVKLGYEYLVSPGLHEVTLSAGAEMEETLARLRGRSDVLFAEPDYQVRALGTVTPNDPGFNSLWGLQKIKAPEAWGTTTGSRSTIVAVIDSGVDYNHPDLRANMWVNAGEIAGDWIDNDGNGYVDDVYGWDFANNDANPMDDNGHGTHVAGTIGAVTNNGTGVAGINWNTRIMALKFLNASGTGYLSHAIKALDYAVANGARISNNSWGGMGYATALYTAIYNARTAGHIFVAAAGNDGLNLESSPSYPASFNLDNIISVAATDSNDNLASFSNYGSISVDLGAPGVSILSTVPGGYQYMSGTSMATPHVAGVAALVWSQNPGWTYSQVISRVLSTGDPVASLSGKTVTGRRLNAAAAVGTSTNRAPLAAADSTSVAEDGWIDIAVLANDSDPDGNALTIASFTQPANGSVVNAGAGLLRYTPKANFFGTDSFSYTASDGKGGTARATVTVTVTPVNDAPTANGDSYSLPAESGTTRLNVLANDSILPDAGETLTITSVSAGSAGGVLAIVSGTAIDYTPRTGFAGTETFTYTISDGNGGTSTATVAVSVAAPDPEPSSSTIHRFDFGTASSPLETGYTRVSMTTAYSASQGYGWQSGLFDERDRGTGTSLTRDLIQTYDGTFAVNLASGTYTVSVTLGDASWAHDQNAVYLEGVQVDTVSNAAGQFVTRTYTVNVTDGQLTLRLRDTGGNYAFAVINALEISGSDTAVPSGDVQGPRATGATASGTLTGPIDRVAITFDEAVQDGTFTVADARLTGPAGAIAISAVNKLSSTQYEVLFASQSAAGTYQLTVGPNISDTAGNLMDQNGNGVNGENPADAYVVTFSLQPPPPSSSAYRFDFGTAGSPLESGYTRVTMTTGYSGSQGYGWQSGSIGDRDRGTGSNLTRDLHQTYDGTFAVDLANGTYTVTVTTGDASYAHDQNAVYLEGVQVDTVSNAAGQFVTRTYTVDVTDGQLTLRLRDTGGNYAYAVINSLEIAAVPASSASESDEELGTDELDEVFSDLNEVF